MTFRHIVLFRVRGDVTDPDVSAALDALQNLGGVAGASAWHVAMSLDERKGRVVVEDATFASAEAFSLFRALPAHQAVVARMAEISDWWVGDYEISLAKSASQPGQSG